MRPLDLVAIIDLNPHIAVARLQRESHDELVGFFVRAQPGDVSEILEVFLEPAEHETPPTTKGVGTRERGLGSRGLPGIRCVMSVRRVCRTYQRSA
jgi:hypothetical protein